MCLCVGPGIVTAKASPQMPPQTAQPAVPVATMACTLEPGSTHVVARVEPSGSLILDDGREVVLMGALLATPPQPENGPNPALRALLEGRPVELAFAGRRFDRYGRLLAHVFVRTGEQRLWVQGHLIEAGLARAYALPGHTTCLVELITHEQRARQRASALWGQAHFQDRDVSDARALLRYRDTFQSVVGRVENVVKVRGETVLIFTAEGLSGFNVTIPRPARASTSGLKSWSDLRGKTVRVRGWVDQRRGPAITLNDAREIEVLHESTEPDSTGSPNESEPEAPRPIPVIEPAP